MKWLLIVVLVTIATLLALFLFGRKSVHTQIDIPAPPDDVWAVLTDTKRYPEWNPILEPIKGNYEEGQTMTYRMTIDGSTSEVSSKIVKLESGRLLNQFGGMTGVLTFNHHWVLEHIPSGTRVTQYEDYRGIAVPFWNPASVQVAYEEANRGLRRIIVGDTNDL